jgi:alpha-beta hydrolase superfamily lysophospholipase
MTDETESPTPSLVRRAGWVVRDWWYAAAWQVRSLRPSTAAGYRTGDRQPVVVVPGIYETWEFMRPLMDALHARGHPIYVVTALKYNLRTVPDSAELVIAAIDRERLHDVLLLAHSKGGLIGKYAMERLDPEQRIDRMIAIATPFAGSAYACLAPGRQLRAFRAKDPVLSALARDVGANPRITSLYGVFDTMIPEGSELAGATNRRLRVGGHFSILSDPRTLAAVLEAAGD